MQKAGVAKIILLGHLGRPGGKSVASLSLKPVANWFTKNVAQCRLMLLDNLKKQSAGNFFLLENLRFDPGEKANDQKFARKISSLGDVYINDAFGTAHRKHTSIVGLPNLLPAFLGIRIEGEMQTLSWLRDQPSRPLVFTLGGSKPGKLDYLEFLLDWADKVLVGGKLPALVKNSKDKIKNSKKKLILGQLRESGKDIDDRTIREFKKVIGRAETAIWAGPMGVYEKKEFRQGSWQIAKAVANSNGFKVAGGGDTHRILTKVRLWDRMDYVSTGGGAMLEFLKKKDLPGIKAIRDWKK